MDYWLTNIATLQIQKTVKKGEDRFLAKTRLGSRESETMPDGEKLSERMQAPQPDSALNADPALRKEDDGHSMRNLPVNIRDRRRRGNRIPIWEPGLTVSLHIVRAGWMPPTKG